MTANGFAQLLFYLVVLGAAATPLGWYIARVFERRPTGLDWLLGPVERFIYTCCGTQADQESDWKSYTIALLTFNAVGLMAVFVLQLAQGALPLNPQRFPALSIDSAFNSDRDACRALRHDRAHHGDLRFNGAQGHGRHRRRIDFHPGPDAGADRRALPDDRISLRKSE